MQVEHNPDDYETHTEHTTCQFHKDNPGVPYAGCTCTYSLHKKNKEPKPNLKDDV